MGWDPLEAFSEAIGTNKSSGALAQATGNVLAPGGTFAPGAGGLNPLNPDSIVGRMTKDVGQLNPFNPDTVMAGVYNNIGKDMQRDPLKWVAIAAAVATGQVYLIPYINGVATVTSKNSSPEEWLTEGAKAYLISAGGEYVANNVTGVGPQTDITTGETFAGTGASGAAGSAQAGAVAGNISRNIFATAARKGSTDVNSAQIITGAITNEALNEAFKYMPGFSDLSKSDQTTAVNAFKVAATKDGNAAYQLFNQGFDATIKGLNKAATYSGYKDLNEQNTVNNFVMAGGSKEDIDALTQREKASQEAYAAYEPENQKLLTWNAKLDDYNDRLARYTNPAVIPYTERYGLWQSLNADWPWFQDANNVPDYNKVVDLWGKYTNSWRDVNTYTGNLKTLQDQGWDNLAQQKEAAAAGYTDPEKYDTYLTDKKAAERAEVTSRWQKAMDEEAAVNEGWDNLDEKKAAATAGYTDPEKYDTYLADKTANETAKTEGWTSSAQKAEAAAAGYTDPEKYDTYLTDKTANEAAVSEGWTSSKQKAEAAAAGYTNPAVYDNYLTDKQANTDAIAQGWTGSDQKAEAAALGYTDPTEYTNYLSGLNTGGDDTIISGGGDDTVEGGGDGKVDTTCADGFHWDEGRQMCIADDDVDTTCADGFHWDEGRQMCIADTDAEEESTDCPDGYLYNLSTKSCDPIGGGPSLPPIKLDKKKDKVTTSTTTTNTGNTTITTGGNTVIVTGNNTVVANSDNSGKLLALLGLMGNGGQQQAPYTPAQVPVADIKSYYNTIRGIAGEELLPESKEEKDKSGVDSFFAGGGTVNKSYDDVIRGIAGERLLDPPEEKKKKSSIEEMFFEGGTVDDLLRILRG